LLTLRKNDGFEKEAALNVPAGYHQNKPMVSAGHKCGLFLLALILIGGLISLPACSSTTATKTKLLVFEADSLMVPFARIEKEFEAQNPDIDVELQAHGSIQVIRQVTELGQDVDVVAVADYSLIPMLMYATKMPDGRQYADWYIKPATNTMVLAYTANSKYADQLTADNWYDIVSRPDVKFGLADPRMDAVGYRTLMLDSLAETYYKKDDILRDMLGNSFKQPITELTANGKTTVTVPELLEPSDDHMVLRGANMQLLALLESNDVDYTFDYKSVVLQHKLKYIELPPEINLGDTSLASQYNKVVVKLDFRRFQTVDPVFAGVPIGYGLTIANNSKHQPEAVRFLQFILGTDGQGIFNECNHPELIPPECDSPAALPDVLKSLFR
jgi:molybdate/tungstate transport system substrate-binding protein